MSKYTYNKNYFSVIDTAEKAYWLGFLYADGCITCFRRQNRSIHAMTLSVTLCAQDVQHLYKLRDCLCSDVPITYRIAKYKDKEYKSCSIKINCTAMCRDLIALNCTPNKTYTITFPSEQLVPVCFQRDFIRGYFDGDGCISTTIKANKPHIECSFTGMSTMLQQIANVLLNNHIIRRVPKIYADSRSKAHSIHLYGTDSNKEFLDYLYENASMFLDRKYNKYIQFYKDYQPINKRGVYWHKQNKAYVVTIYINGKQKRIGQFKNLDDAIQARKNAEIEKMNIINKPT